MGAGGYDGEAGDLSELDGEGAGCGAAAVDEDGGGRFDCEGGGPGKAKGLVESLADGGDAHAQGGGLFHEQIQQLCPQP